MAEYTLKYTANEIEEKLEKTDSNEQAINQLSQENRDYWSSFFIAFLLYL